MDQQELYLMEEEEVSYLESLGSMYKYLIVGFH
jgi:hypothetical protein